MKNKIKTQIEKDIYRFYGKTKLSIREKILISDELKYIITFRKIQGAKNLFLKNYYRFKLRKISKRTLIQIPYKTKIGEGFYIGHTGRIIISSDVVIVKNVNVATGVTIGKTNRGDKKGMPTIGNNVWVGTNSVIVGKITIGDDVLIAPNAYVNFDVPSHSIVIGNPAIIKQRNNATQDYICNCID